MFTNKDKNLEKISEKRKEKISFFKVSIEFDWFVIVSISIILIIFTFIVSILEIKKIENYTPVTMQTDLLLLEEQKILDDADKIIIYFQNLKNSSSTDID